jgi:hypothetical protein
MTIELHLPTPHEKQQYLLDNRVRFNVLKCGRRFGKTEICQELILEIFEAGQLAGYFSPTYKDLYEVWKTTLNNFHDVIDTKSETVKQIVFINGAKVDFWSMEEPNSGRGRKYHRVIMDECEKAQKFQEAWEQSISPTLTDYGGDAYFLSTPKFGDTYFKQLCKKQDENPELWKTFIYSTYDNPHIKIEEIEVMKSMLPPPVFDCEYMAMDVDGKALNPFAHQYDPVYHENEINYHHPERQIYIIMDFNINPYAVTFYHHYQDIRGFHWEGFDEVSIDNGSLDAMADEINMRYGKYLHSAILSGDSLGKNRNITLKDNASNYTYLLRKLNMSKHQLKVPENPRHTVSRTDTNELLWNTKKANPTLFFSLNKRTMPQTCWDMRNVQCDAAGEIKKRNRNDLSQKADFFDNVRNFINLTAKPILLRLRK